MSAVAAGLRAAADLIEQHPDLPAPYVTALSRVEAKWFLQLDKDADQKEQAAKILRSFGGKWTKDGGRDDVMTFRSTSSSLDLLVQVARDAVCERVVVGTETVTHPAKPAEPERTETVEKVEWRCEPVLAEAAS